MTLEVTSILLAIGLAMAGYGLWRGRREHVPGKPPLIPPGLFLFLGLVLSFVMAGHLITLLTGVPFAGRGQPN